MRRSRLTLWCVCCWCWDCPQLFALAAPQSAWRRLRHEDNPAAIPPDDDEKTEFIYMPAWMYPGIWRPRFNGGGDSDGAAYPGRRTTPRRTASSSRACGASRAFMRAPWST